MIRQIKKQVNHQLTQNTLPTNEEVNHSSVESQFVSSSPPLTDADCEFLFNQLLEGVAHGWHQIKIAKFFQRLEEKGEPQLWVAWLERYGTKILTSSGTYQQQLGARMIRLGELAQSHPSIKQIGIAAYNLGRQLLYDRNPNLIWEYNGADLLIASEATTTETKDDRQATIQDNVPGTTEKKTTETADDRQATIQEGVQTVEPNESPSPSSSSSFTQAANWIQDAIAEFVELAEKATDESVTAKSDTEDQSEHKPSSETIELSESEANRLEQQSEELSPTNSAKIEKEENLNEEKSNLVKANNIKPSVLEDESVINLSWQQFVELVQQDDNLVEQIAQQFELTDKDPNSIIQALTNQLGRVESSGTNESTIELLESWFNLGLKQASTGNLEEAILSWEKALELNPNLAEAWHNRGSALGRLGNYEEALASFEQALKIDSGNAQAWNDRAHSLYQLGKWQEAVASWNKAIAIIPSNYQFWYNRGCALEELKQYQEAIASYEKSLEIKPDFELARSRYISLLGDRHTRN